MKVETIKIRQLGTPRRSREVGAALALALGAGAVALCTGAFGFKLYENLAVLGAAATLAWLIDGSAQRYLGAGVAALTIGGGLTLGKLLNVPGYEHMVVYGFLGLGLMLVSYVNPKAIAGSAGFLLLVSSTVAALQYVYSYNGGWELTAILGFWSACELARVWRASTTAASTDDGKSALTGSESLPRPKQSVAS